RRALVQPRQPREPQEEHRRPARRREMKRAPLARRLLKHALLGVFSLLFAAAVCEGLILLALAHPSIVPRLPRRLEAALHYLYSYYDRDIIQLEPAMARYDDKLFYTLKPGTFTFANREF